MKPSWPRTDIGIILSVLTADELARLKIVAQRQEFSAVHILTHLADIIESGDDPEDHYDTFLALKYWMSAEHFDRKEANRRLYDYAHGENPLVWA